MFIIMSMQCFGALVDWALKFPLMPPHVSQTEVLRHTAFSDGAKTYWYGGVAAEWQSYMSVYLLTRLLYVALFTS